jgi:pimeloyl-ACP methyl ester carboxylesterase
MDDAFGIPALPLTPLPSERWNRRLLSRFGTALDASVLRAMQLVVERALIPDDEDVVALRDSARSLLDPELQREPRRFFAFLSEPATPVRETSRLQREVPGGVVVRRLLSTAYRPYLADEADAGRTALRHPILLEHWMHRPGPPRATVLSLHGFTMGRPRIDAVALFASRWYRCGLDVALMTLPQHGERTPPGARFSGEAFAVPHVARLAEAVREAIYEIRVVTRWLRERSEAPVGVLGLSLGGYLTALLAGLCDDPDFVVPMVPPACFGDLAWRFLTRTRHYRRGGVAAFSRDELRAAFRIHSPLAHPLQVPKARVLIVAGRGDRIVPPEHPMALWEHWGRPAIHWFSGSHVAPFGRRRIVGAIVRHLESLDIL